MKIFRPLLLLLITAVVSQAFAQRRLVVVDVETLVPVIGANVVSADGNTTTDSLGYFSVSDSCRSLAFSHVNYEPRMINLTEVRDTVYLTRCVARGTEETTEDQQDGGRTGCC